MLADVLVGARAFISEQLGVFVRNDGHDVEERPRDDDLALIGKPHDPLRDVDAVANDVRVAVDVADQLDRPEVDPDAQRQRFFARFPAGTGVGTLHHVAKVHGDEQGVFRVAQKTERGTVAGIQDQPLVRGNVRKGGRKQRGKAILEHDLLGYGPL